MAISYARSPWNLVKRLRISSQPSLLHRASLFTTRSLREDVPDDVLDDVHDDASDDILDDLPYDLTDDLGIRETVEHNLIEWADRLEMPLPQGLRSPRRDLDGKILGPDENFTVTPEDEELRLPRSVQALYLKPLRRKPTHGIKVCDLQLRSYSVRNLEFMADFAMRAAYYLNLPAKGPVPLPRITQRWTVPRANFIFKKSQENWERITLRRLVQIQDGDSDVVRRWLGFLRKWCWYGVGLKANVWEFETLDVVKNMDANKTAEKEAMASVNWELIGTRRGMGTPDKIEKMLNTPDFVTQKPTMQPIVNNAK